MQKLICHLQVTGCDGTPRLTHPSTGEFLAGNKIDIRDSVLSIFEESSHTFKKVAPNSASGLAGQFALSRCVLLSHDRADERYSRDSTIDAANHSKYDAWSGTSHGP